MSPSWQNEAELKFAETSHNVVAYLEDPPAEHKIFQSMVAGLNKCCLSKALLTDPIIHKDIIIEFWKNAEIIVAGEDGVEVIMSKVNDSDVVISEQTIRQVLDFGDQPRFPTEYSYDSVKAVLDQMGYEGSYPPIHKKLLPPFWRFLAHTYFHCISGRKSGSDELSHVLSSAIVSLTMGWEYNYSKYVLDDMKGNLHGKKHDPFLKYPRFLQMIFDAEYPQIARTGDTLDFKTLGPTTFKYMKQTRKGSKFVGNKPLVKLGLFADNVAGEVAAAEVPEVVPAAPAVQENVGDIEPEEPEVKPQPLPQSQPQSQTSRQFVLEILSDDDEESDATEQEQFSGPTITEEEIDALIFENFPALTLEEIEAERLRQAELEPFHFTLEEIEAERLRQAELEPFHSVFAEVEEDVDPAATLVQRKRRRVDQVEEDLDTSTAAVNEPTLDDMDVQENVNMELDHSVPSPVTEQIFEPSPLIEEQVDLDTSEKQTEDVVVTEKQVEEESVLEKSAEEENVSEKQIGKAVVQEEVIPAVNLEEMFVPTETIHTARSSGAGGSSMPSSSQAGGSSSRPTSSSMPFLGKGIALESDFVDVQLQNRVFELEKDSSSKDVMIGNLNIRVSNLEKDNSAKDLKIATLEDNLGSLTASFLELKQLLSQKFGDTFSEEQAPQPSTAKAPRVRTPASDESAEMQKYSVTKVFYFRSSQP